MKGSGRGCEDHERGSGQSTGFSGPLAVRNGHGGVLDAARSHAGQVLRCGRLWVGTVIVAGLLTSQVVTWPRLWVGGVCCLLVVT